MEEKITITKEDNDKMLSKYKCYDTDLDNLEHYLKEYGIAVIPEILNNDEVINFQNGIWNCLNEITKHSNYPVVKNDINSWNTYFNLYPSNDMLIQQHSIGHSQFIWDVRHNEKVANVFAKIWNCNKYDLISSFDAISFHLPPEITKSAFYDGKDWFHMDQALNRNGFDCVQGLISAYDVNEGDSTLCILEGSHKYHEELSKYYNLGKEPTNDFYMLNNNDLEFYMNKKCERYNIKMRAGSLVLWDSRLVHCNMRCLENRSKQNFRLVMYVCQTPIKNATQDIIDMRIRGFENLFMTSHCAHRPFLFQKNNRYIKFKIDEMKPPVLTSLGKSLVGYLID